MTGAASQASAFYRDVARNRKLWTIRDASGYPAPMGTGGKRAHPFWSSLPRVEKVVASVPAYAGFVPDEISWERFCSAWLPGLKRDGLLIGLNWSGARATGYELEPDELLRNVESLMENARS